MKPAEQTPNVAVSFILQHHDKAGSKIPTDIRVYEGVTYGRWLGTVSLAITHTCDYNSTWIGSMHLSIRLHRRLERYAQNFLSRKLTGRVFPSCHVPSVDFEGPLDSDIQDTLAIEMTKLATDIVALADYLLSALEENELRPRRISPCLVRNYRLLHAQCVFDAFEIINHDPAAIDQELRQRLLAASDRINTETLVSRLQVIEHDWRDMNLAIRQHSLRVCYNAWSNNFACTGLRSVDWQLDEQLEARNRLCLAQHRLFSAGLHCADPWVPEGYGPHTGLYFCRVRRLIQSGVADLAWLREQQSLPEDLLREADKLSKAFKDILKHLESVEAEWPAETYTEPEDETQT